LEIGIGGQSNIGNWENTGEKNLKISVSVSKNDIGRPLVRRTRIALLNCQLIKSFFKLKSGF